MALNFTSTSQSYNAGNPAVQLDSGLTLGYSATNGETFESATVKISNFQTGDVLGFTIPAGLPANIQTTLTGLGFSAGDFVSVNQINTALTSLNINTTQLLGFNVTLNYDSTNGELTMSGNASVDDYQQVLQLVAFQTSSSDTTTRQIDYSLDATGLDASTGNFYQYVSNQNNPITWTDANTGAGNSTYFGLQGYLATITTQAENNFIAGIIGDNAWIGGSDSAVEGSWEWVTGPENGNGFWSGDATGSNVNNAYTNWGANEPNDNNGEDYAHIIGNSAIGTVGQWNDVPDSILAAEFNDFNTKGYVVEYGGSASDPALSFTGSIDVTFGSNVTASNWEVKAVEDFGADSKADILWYETTTGDVGLWQMDGATELSKVTFDTVAPSTNWMIADAGDANGDNKADILWHNNVTGQVGLWEMSGNSVVAKNTIGVTVNPSLGWEIVEMADVDGDKNDDIIWRNGNTGENGIWRLDGQQVVEYKTIHQVADSNWKIVGAADFDGDGKEDLLWHNSDANYSSAGYSSNNAVWLMDGTEVKEYGYISPITGTDWMVAGTDDFNGDGKADIAWRNGSTGENTIWTMDGTNTVSQDLTNTLTDTDWNIVGTGDFGGDGNADLMFRNQNLLANGSNNAIWEMNGPTVLSQSFIDPA